MSDMQTDTEDYQRGRTEGRREVLLSIYALARECDKVAHETPGEVTERFHGRVKALCAEFGVPYPPYLGANNA